MPGPPPTAGAKVLGQMQQIAIRDIHILEPAGMTFQRGGCDRPGATLRAEVVDMSHGTLYMLPISISYARVLYQQLGDLIKEHDARELSQ